MSNFLFQSNTPLAPTSAADQFRYLKGELVLAALFGVLFTLSALLHWDQVINIGSGVVFSFFGSMAVSRIVDLYRPSIFGRRLAAFWLCVPIYAYVVSLVPTGQSGLVLISIFGFALLIVLVGAVTRKLGWSFPYFTDALIKSEASLSDNP